MLNRHLLVHGLVPAGRSLPSGTIAAVLALAAAPTVVTTVRGGTELRGAVLAAVVVGAAACALAVDDEAGETVTAVPVPLATRRLVRLVTLAAAIAVVWVLLAAVVGAADPRAIGRLDLRLAEVAATSGLALAAAGLADRWRLQGAAAGGALAGVLAVLLTSGLATRYQGLPMLGAVAHHDRWWLAAAVGWAVAAWSSRDPLTP